MKFRSEGGNPSTQSVFEAYGATMYVAQILESDLQIILTQLEKARLIRIDREQYRITEDKFGVIEACIGPRRTPNKAMEPTADQRYAQISLLVNDIRNSRGGSSFSR